MMYEILRWTWKCIRFFVVLLRFECCFFSFAMPPRKRRGRPPLHPRDDDENSSEEDFTPKGQPKKIKYEPAQPRIIDKATYESRMSRALFLPIEPIKPREFPKPITEKMCENCKTTQTKYWRKGPSGLRTLCHT